MIKQPFQSQFKARALRLVPFPCLLLLLFIGACKQPNHQAELSAAQVRGNNLGQLRGPSVIQSMIGRRLGVAESRLNLFFYSQKNAVYAQLAPIMGGFANEGIKNTFANGAPNSVNMYLWEKVLTNLGQTLADSPCDLPYPETDDSFQLSQETQQILGTCATAPTAPSEANPLGLDSKKLWKLLLEEDAPEEEFTAWTRWLRSPAFQAAYKNPKDRLGAAIAGAWMNPYFLLEN